MLDNYEKLSQTLYKDYINHLSKLEKTIAKHRSYIEFTAMLSILTTHPRLQDDQEKVKEEGILDFLKCIDKVFTTNYDLILYRLIMLINTKNAKFSDGFLPLDHNYLEFKNYFLTKAFFCLHGAFYIGTRDNQTVKLKGVLQNSEFVEDIIQRINEKFWPGCVLGVDKKSTIRRNDYLSICRERFREIKDNLVVFGHSLEQDEHIVEWISHNRNLKNVIIYYYGDKGKSSIEEQINKISKKREKFGILCKKKNIWPIPKAIGF